MKNLNLLDLTANGICNFFISLIAIIIYTITCYTFFALLGLATWLLAQTPERPKSADEPSKANARWNALYKSLMDSPVQPSITGLGANPTALF